MWRLGILVATFLAFSPAVSSTAFVQNTCRETICAYKVSPKNGDLSKPHKINPGKSQAFKYPKPTADSTSILVSPDCNPKHYSEFEFGTGDDLVTYYAASNGKPFKGGFVIKGSSGDCPVVDCRTGNHCPVGTVESCNQSNDITFVAC